MNNLDQVFIMLAGLACFFTPLAIGALIGDYIAKRKHERRMARPRRYHIID